MPRIVLLNPPGRRIYQRDWYDGCVVKGHYLWPPVNLVVQSGWLARAGDLDVVDAIAERLSPAACLDRLVGLAPDVVVLLTGSASWSEDLAFGEALRERTGAWLVGHGDAFTFAPQAALARWPFVDAALYDFTSGGLVAWLEGGPTGGPYRGVIHRDRPRAGTGGAVIEGEPDRSRGPLDFPLPRHELFPLASYRMPFGPVEPLATVLTNYGCPHSCHFCNKPALGFRLRPLEHLDAELDHVHALGVRRLFVADMTFNVSRPRVEEVCEVLARRSMRWSGYARPDHLDREQVLAMKASGAIALHFGVESGDDDVLGSNGKAMETERVVEAFALCREAGIRAGAHFIVGLPGETAGGIERTVRLAASLTPDFASVNVAVPRLGTELRHGLARTNGWADPLGDDPLDSSADVRHPLTPALDRDALSRGRRRLMRTLYFRPSFVARQLRTVRSGPEAVNLLLNGLKVIRAYAS